MTIQQLVFCMVGDQTHKKVSESNNLSVNTFF